ncbi:hypothetical protein D3C85_1276070 [compost metagenome]
MTSKSNSSAISVHRNANGEDSAFGCGQLAVAAPIFRVEIHNLILTLESLIEANPSGAKPNVRLEFVESLDSVVQPHS